MLPYRDGTVEYAVSAPISGRTIGDTNTTLFLHGLAGSIEDTRPLASGVHGTKVFAHLPGHGRSTGPVPLGYEVLAAAARAVADHTGARCALGVSIGAATILRIVAETPDRFDRVVLFLPPAADTPPPGDARVRHRALAERLTARDEAGAAAALLTAQPIAVRSRRIARDWAARRAVELIAAPGDPYRLLPLATAAPVDDLDRLRDVTIPVLLIAQEGDPAHPVEVARTIAAAFPNASLEVFDSQGALWGHRRVLRTIVAPFIDGACSVTNALDLG